MMWIGIKDTVSHSQFVSVRWQNMTCLIRIKFPVPYSIFVDHNVICYMILCIQATGAERKKANLIRFASPVPQQEVKVIIDW